MRDIRRRDVYRFATPKPVQNQLHLYIREQEEQEPEKILKIKTKKFFLPKIIFTRKAILFSAAVFGVVVLVPVFQRFFPQVGYTDNNLIVKAFNESTVSDVLSQKNNLSDNSAQQLASFSRFIQTKKDDSRDATQIKIAMTERSDFDSGQNLNVPDYVFEEDYKLRSIEELKDFIATNRHLPGVTSRDEIKRFGINFGSMMMSILEKTEENTLYIINNADDIKKHKTAIENLLGKSLTLEERVSLVIKNISNKDSIIKKISASVESLENEQEKTDASLKNIEDQIDLIQQQNQAVINFALALDTKNLVYKDSLGNINLAEGKITAKDIEVLGALKAKEVETETLKMSEDRTSGKGIIKAGLAEVVIETPEASKKSKIYLTSTSSNVGRTLYVSDQDIVEGKSFKVRFDGDLIVTDISFNWLIIK
jgi:hypothetical protein